MNKLFPLLVLFLVLAACRDNRWEQTNDGVIVHLKPDGKNQTRTLQLRVVSDRIIRVVATPEKKIPEIKSLCVQDPDQSPVFILSEEKGNVMVAAGGIKAAVSLSGGRVTFYDEGGDLLLQEKEEGRTFWPVTAEETRGFSMRQQFLSPDDEAFYGLGQHQSDEFNYKGLNQELYQYNTKVSLPVVVSSRNYGIVWDNYSYTRFGDAREYSNLDLFTLYDTGGKPGGLTASYYANGDTTAALFTRQEQVLDYENLETVRNFPEGFRFSNSTVIWKGEMEPAESGLFYFRLYYAGYTRLWINGELVVPERWRTAWNPNAYKFTLSLEEGKKYPVRLEWKPDGGISYIGLKVHSPLPEEEQKSLSLWSEMGKLMDYYVISGNNLDEVISGYRTLTGKAPVMPRWAMGYWQSRERYKTSDELLNVIHEYRKREIPLDNIVLDWFYWPEDSWGSHEFDTTRFPDPKAMVDSVHRMNARIMISVWPKFYHTTEHFREFDSKGWMYRQAVTDSVRDWVGKGYIGSFYDAYNPEARKLFWQQMKDHLYPHGFDAWWMDASEPDILSNAGMAYRKQLSTPTALGPSTQYFNAYALMNAEAIYNGQRESDPDKRVFLLTRSGFPGLQRYSTATWSGDIGTRWEDMKAQISAGLNFSLSGIPYWTMDIGGFCVESRYTTATEGSEDLEEWRELNARWFQFGAFCPLFRSHGQYPFREIYHIAPPGHPAYQTMVFYNKLRYRLMPYIYSLAGMTWLNDQTIMRALVMDFHHDPLVHNIGDQYLFGPSLMVAPVYQYKARNRMVYFPASTGWYDLLNGKYTRGGQILSVEAPYQILPLFVREGTILPVGPDIRFTGEKPADPITLFVYRGADASFILYEDEGTNYNYENGSYATIPFRYDEQTGRLTIGDRKGSFAGMQEDRVFRIIGITPKKPRPFHPEGKPDASVTYSGKEISVLL